MIVGEVKIEKHDKGIGWYRMTIISLSDSIGQTKVELLIREEFLRTIRNAADRALSNKQLPNILEFLKDE